MDQLFTLEGLFTLDNLIAFLALAALEIVLGIDNVVFLSILTQRLPEKQQPLARRVGLILAMVMRIVLLIAISWVMRLESDLFTVLGEGFSGKELILLGGGFFLVAKATHEIHNHVEGEDEEEKRPAGTRKVYASMGSVLAQVVVMDAIFSLDSVITAVGMAKNGWVMAAAIVTAIVVMLVFAERISAFIARHPTTKVLALAFLVLIGVVLMAEAFEQHVEKGYIYTAMAFSLAVELINLRAQAIRRRKREAASE